jgi:hypothetical protein
MKSVALCCDVDDCCQSFAPVWQQRLLGCDEGSVFVESGCVGVK